LLPASIVQRSLSSGKFVGSIPVEGAELLAVHPGGCCPAAMLS
jgi:hypothetical protein